MYVDVFYAILGVLLAVVVLAAFMGVLQRKGALKAWYLTRSEQSAVLEHSNKS